MRKYTLLLGTALVASSLFAQSKYSAYSQYVVEMAQANTTEITHQRNPLKSVSTQNEETYIDVFIRVDEGADLAALEDAGAVIGVATRSCVTAQVPVQAFNTIAELEMVKRIEVARTARLLCDNARTNTNHANTVNGVEGETEAYTGKGVIYGTIDSGIDFNHVNFKNDDTTTRLLAAYLPDKTTGTKVKGRVYYSGSDKMRNGTYPGTFFLTNAAIKGITTDLTGESHGTHTMGAAAGSYNGKYQGFAPEASIIACGTPNLTATNMINTAAYIFDRADSLDMPAVINYSIGYNVGAHDGSDIEAYMLDELISEKPEGRIVCIAAGNEGSDKLHIKHTFDSVPVKTCIIDYYNSQYIESQIDIWSNKTDTELKATLSIIDSSGKEVYATTDTCCKSKSTVVLDSNFKKYFSGSATLYFAEGGEDGCDNIFIDLNGRLSSKSARLCLTFESTEGDEVNVWTDTYSLLSSNNIAGFTNGDTDMSINTMACGEHSIVVGAYQNATKITDKDGFTYQYSGNVGERASFSSYGPSADGRQLPHILGPGKPLVSSVNTYDTNYTSASSSEVVCAKVSANSRNNYWGAMSGTSMSTPVVAGIIATWLQANPELTSSDIIEIFKATATTDKYTTNTQKCGHGRINSYEGLKHILANYSSVGTLNATAPLTRYSGGVFTIFAPSQEEIAVNVYSLNGTLAASTTSSATSEEVAVDLNNLPSGAYIIRATGTSLNFNTKVIVK